MITINNDTRALSDDEAYEVFKEWVHDRIALSRNSEVFIPDMRDAVHRLLYEVIDDLRKEERIEYRDGYWVDIEPKSSVNRGRRPRRQNG